MCRDTDEVLQALDVNFGGILSTEQVDEQALGQCVLGFIGILEYGAVESHERLQANTRLFVLELLQCAEGLWINVQLEHVEELVIERTGQREAVGSLLGVKRQDEERGIVLEREELERGGIVEGVDVVLLGETLDKGSLETGEIGDGQLENLRRLLAAYEEGRLGVLVLLRLACLECACCAGILGFPVQASVIRFGQPCLRGRIIHCLQHNGRLSEVV